MTTPETTPSPPMTLKAADRARYMVEGPLHPWQTEETAYSRWTAIRCKNHKALRMLMACLHTASLLMAPKITHGTTLFIPSDAWNGFGQAIIEGMPLASEIQTLEVCHRAHLNPTFLGRFGRPGHSKQHAWYQAFVPTRSGTPHNAYSNTFLLRRVVEAEMRQAHEDYVRTERRKKTKPNPDS